MFPMEDLQKDYEEISKIRYGYHRLGLKLPKDELSAHALIDSMSDEKAAILKEYYRYEGDSIDFEKWSIAMKK